MMRLVPIQNTRNTSTIRVQALPAHASGERRKSCSASATARVYTPARATWNMKSRVVSYLAELDDSVMQAVDAQRWLLRRRASALCGYERLMHCTARPFRARYKMLTRTLPCHSHLHVLYAKRSLVRSFGWPVYVLSP
jgi:hypothetical protein